MSGFSSLVIYLIIELGYRSDHRSKGRIAIRGGVRGGTGEDDGAKEEVACEDTDDGDYKEGESETGVITGEENRCCSLAMKERTYHHWTTSCSLR